MNKSDRIFKYVPLWGNWKVEEEIGKGNFGTVYKVTSNLYDKKYISAVKFITIPSKEQYDNFYSEDIHEDNDFEEYFSSIVKNMVNEIDLLYKLRGHSNIISYEDHMVKEHTDGIGWDILIRMELVTSLRDYISKNDLKIKDILKIGIDISKALEVCHNNGIIHRDIKEGNLFISGKGMYKLGDFSVSKDFTGIKSTGTRVGTIQYMCPEVMNGRPYKSNVDIYSFGLVLFKLLNYGRAPFLPYYPNDFNDDDIEKSQLKRLLGEKLPLPQNCDEKFGKIIWKACESDPEKRYKKAADLRRDLEKLFEIYSEDQLDRLVLSSDKDKVFNQDKILNNNNDLLIDNNKSDENNNDIQNDEKKNNYKDNDVEVEKNVLFSEDRELNNFEQDYLQISKKTNVRKIAIGVGIALIIIIIFSSIISSGFGTITPITNEENIIERSEISVFEDKEFEKLVKKELNMENKTVNDNDLKNLTKLKISGDIELKNLNDLIKLKNLNVLYINNQNSLDFTIIGKLKLEKLFLNNSNIEDVSFIKNNKDIRVLDLSNNNINDISDINDLDNLEELNLKNNKIKIIDSLSTNKNLKKIQISKNEIENIKELDSFHSLEYLDIRDNKIIDTTYIENYKNIKELLFDKSDFKKQGTNNWYYKEYIDIDSKSAELDWDYNLKMWKGSKNKVFMDENVISLEEGNGILSWKCDKTGYFNLGVTAILDDKNSKGKVNMEIKGEDIIVYSKDLTSTDSLVDEKIVLYGEKGNNIIIKYTKLSGDKIDIMYEININEKTKFDRMNDFQSKQGHCGWYCFENSDVLTELVWQLEDVDNTQRWMSKENPEDWIGVWSDIVHPGEKDLVIRWLAPKDGKINIDSNKIYLLDRVSGDGVLLKMLKNNELMWEDSLENKDETNFKIENLEVNQNDSLEFIINRNGFVLYDAIYFVPVIEYH